MALPGCERPKGKGESERLTRGKNAERSACLSRGVVEQIVQPDQVQLVDMGFQEF